MTRHPATPFTLGPRFHLLASGLLVSVGILSVPTGAARSQTTQSTIQVHTAARVDGVVFTKGVHGNLLADIFLPSTQGLRPAIVFLHGGAWKSGDRGQLQEVALSLADDGYVGMAVDYDLTDRGDTFPVALKECEQAVSWLRENASKYGVNPHRIAVAGSSAGGELAALVALDISSPKSAKVQAAVVFNGVLDLSWVGPGAEEMVIPYLGKSCAADRALCRLASPVDQVHRGAPPFFVGHGTADKIVPFSQAEHFVRLLKKDDVPVTPFIADEGGHTYWHSPAFFKPNLSAVVAFLASAMPER